MNPQPESSPNEVPDYQPPVETPMQPVEPSQSPVTIELNKKSKKLFITTVVAVILIFIGINSYLLLTNSTKPKTDTNSVSSQTITGQSTTNQAATKASLDSITKILTDGSSSESSLTNTDDSSNADAASASATNVGSSINENNF